MPSEQPRRWLWPMFVLAWLVMVAIGLVLLWSYKLGPGSAAAAPTAWPRASSLERSQSDSTLLVFIHPRCPCSVATLAELEVALTRSPTTVPEIIVYVPDGQPDAWAHGATWSSALAVPRARIRIDRGGHEAKRFGAGTSGHVILFSSAGRQLFAGGITPARGHVGAGPGRAGLVAALEGLQTNELMPVFGCSLATLLENLR